MFTKLYEKMKEIIKRNKYYFLLFIVTFLVCTIEFPYYIESPGGIIDICKKIDINTPYKTEGSLNMAYVTEYKATIPTLLIAQFKKDWNIIKQDVQNENDTDDATYFRNHILLEEANYNASKVALDETNIPYTINNQKLYITYIFEEAKTNLKVGDTILKINGNLVESKEKAKEILSKTGDTVTFTVLRNEKEETCTADWIFYEDSEILGIAISEVGKIESKTSIQFHFNKNESGPSGGLMMSLALYNALTKEDITKGRKIVGTGTIDSEGNVGEIDGVDYKLKAAVKEHADIFLVPAGENYKIANKLVKENNYQIKLYEIKTFKDALQALQK